MSTVRSTYHHGALRDALLAACLELIEEEGIGAVSVRKVARAAGVSSSAPYHHFADRSDLLAAVAAQGYEFLRADLAAAKSSAPVDDPFAALTEMAEAYLTFARSRSSHFRLMFRPEMSQPEKHPDVQAAGAAAFDVLAEVAAGCVGKGALTGTEASTLAVAWWGVCHGLASLELEGLLAGKAADRDTTAQELNDQVIHLLQSLIARRR
ncbi:TetR/AcrR family transcriptional regulator [Nocardia asteroides]